LTGLCTTPADISALLHQAVASSHFFTAFRTFLADLRTNSACLVMSFGTAGKKACACLTDRNTILQQRDVLGIGMLSAH
jgi:hypothetical protein